MRSLFIPTFVASTVLLTGCAGFISRSANEKVSHALTTAVENQSDVQLIEEALPSYVLLVDGFARQNPKAVSSQQAASTLYNLYAGVVESDARKKQLSAQALDYGLKAISLTSATDLSAQGFRQQAAMDFAPSLDAFKEEHVPVLYSTATAWLGWIQANTDNWQAIAEVAKAKAMLKRVIELNPRYEDGMPYVYLGVLESLMPPASGGRPDVAKKHFEKALELSDGKNLMVKTLYAQYYARSIYNRELHDKLLQDVLEASADKKGYVFINTLAQSMAQKLMVDGEEYFN